MNAQPFESASADISAYSFRNEKMTGILSTFMDKSSFVRGLSGEHSEFSFDSEKIGPTFEALRQMARALLIARNKVGTLSNAEFHSSNEQNSFSTGSLLGMVDLGLFMVNIKSFVKILPLEKENSLESLESFWIIKFLDSCPSRFNEFGSNTVP